MSDNIMRIQGDKSRMWEILKANVTIYSVKKGWGDITDYMERKRHNDQMQCVGHILILI